MTNPTNAPEGVNAPALSTVPVLAGSTCLPVPGSVQTGSASSIGATGKGAGLPDANPVMPTDPDAIGPNAAAVVAFWEGYMGHAGLVMDWFDDGDDDRLEARFATLAEEFKVAVATAGPPVSTLEALALASLQHELLNEAASLKPYTVFGARGVMLKAIAGQLAQLVSAG